MHYNIQHIVLIKINESNDEMNILYVHEVVYGGILTPVTYVL
jgi:hypothetical protein